MFYKCQKCGTLIFNSTRPSEYCNDCMTKYFSEYKPFKDYKPWELGEYVESTYIDHKFKDYPISLSYIKDIKYLNLHCFNDFYIKPFYKKHTK